MERGYNINSMYDAKVDISERCHTFEALNSNAQRSLEKMASGQATKRSAASAPLTAFNQSSVGKTSVSKKDQPFSVCAIDREIPEVIQNDLREAVYQIKDHLYHECGLDLIKSTFYFKYDKSNTLYLVYVAGIQAIEHSIKPDESTATSASVKQTESLSHVNKYGFHPLLRSVFNTINAESKNQSSKAPSTRHSAPINKISAMSGASASDYQQQKTQQLNEALKPKHQKMPVAPQRAKSSGKHSAKPRTKLNYDIAEFDQLHAFQLSS